ncbi:MAG: hypothetical protein AB7J30_16240 [Hyphomicrobium sp.]|uniref:hypothetical protein n=1 Tax=Hyphomicrobium sp. TaxID=82 RepID=UPI003D0B4171
MFFWSKKASAWSVMGAHLRACHDLRIRWWNRARWAASAALAAKCEGVDPDRVNDSPEATFDLVREMVLLAEIDLRHKEHS